MNLKFRSFFAALLILAESTVFAETPKSETKITIPSAAALEAEKAADLEAIRPMAEAIGLTSEEFLARDNILMNAQMSLPVSFMEQIKADPEYADFWVQHQPKPMMYITFAGEQGYQRGKALVANFAAKFDGFWVDYVEVRQANISNIELEKLRNKIEKILNDNNIKFDSGQGHDDNATDAFIKVDVIKPIQEVESVLLKAGIKQSPFVKIRQVPQLPVSFSSIYGGWSLYDPSAVASGKPYNCTIGFSVKNSTGQRGVSTTAHCSNNLSTKGDGTVLKSLTFKGEQPLSGSYDIQWHTAPTTSFSVTNLVRGETARVTGSFPRDLQALGNTVCKYGIITGKTCGKITSLTALHTPLANGSPYPNNTPTYIEVTCDAGTVTCASGGDSGSPVYRKTTVPSLIAYGLLIGGAPLLNTFKYMPINYISVLGISVLTSP